jgi:hypothetical protein
MYGAGRNTKLKGRNVKHPIPIMESTVCTAMMVVAPISPWTLGSARPTIITLPDTTSRERLRPYTTSSRLVYCLSGVDRRDEVVCI